MNKNFQMGIFFILGLIILLVLFEVVSGVSLLKKDKIYYTYFQSVGELRSGSQVKLSGVNVGKVNKISLSDISIIRKYIIYLTLIVVFNLILHFSACLR